MMFKVHTTTVDGVIIYARIDDDGKCRLTCTKDYPEFQTYIMAGGELQDADGNVMTADAAKSFIATLP